MTRWHGIFLAGRSALFDPEKSYSGGPRPSSATAARSEHLLPGSCVFKNIILRKTEKPGS